MIKLTKGRIVMGLMALSVAAGELTQAIKGESMLKPLWEEVSNIPSKVNETLFPKPMKLSKKMLNIKNLDSINAILEEAELGTYYSNLDRGVTTPYLFNHHTTNERSKLNEVYTDINKSLENFHENFAEDSNIYSYSKQKKLEEYHVKPAFLIHNMSHGDNTPYENSSVQSFKLEKKDDGTYTAAIKLYKNTK